MNNQTTPNVTCDFGYGHSGFDIYEILLICADYVSSSLSWFLVMQLVYFVTRKIWKECKQQIHETTPFLHQNQNQNQTTSQISINYCCDYLMFRPKWSSINVHINELFEELSETKLHWIHVFMFVWALGKFMVLIGIGTMFFEEWPVELFAHYPKEFHIIFSPPIQFKLVSIWLALYACGEYFYYFVWNTRFRRLIYWTCSFFVMFFWLPWLIGTLLYGTLTVAFGYGMCCFFRYRHERRFPEYQTNLKIENFTLILISMVITFIATGVLILVLTGLTHTSHCHFYPTLSQAVHQFHGKEKDLLFAEIFTHTIDLIALGCNFYLLFTARKLVMMYRIVNRSPQVSFG